jgi:hypothetical protein
MKTRITIRRKEDRKLISLSKVTSKDLVNAEIVEITSSYEFCTCSKFFKLDEEGNWYSPLRMDRVGYKRTKLTANDNGISTEEVFVSNEEAQVIISREAAMQEEVAQKVISWCDPEDEKDEEGRYWLSAYQGAGVYRLIVKGGKIQGAIYGGFHECDRTTLSLACSDESFMKALEKVVSERIGSDFRFIKADGSGTYFYLRYAEDVEFLKTREYDVPSAAGVSHRNIEVV